LFRVSPHAAAGGLTMPPSSQTARLCVVPSAWGFQVMSLYICTSLSAIQLSNSGGIYFPTWYHEFFSLLQPSRACCHPSALQGCQFPSPLLSLWLVMMLLGLRSSRPPPLYSSITDKMVALQAAEARIHVRAITILLEEE
jgi:hypothetical protein